MAKAKSLSSGLLRKLDRLYDEAPLLRLQEGGQVVVFSDLHLGDGGAADDFAKNAPILRAVLGDFYEKQGYILVLNGDIEELARFSLASIATRWLDIYALWSRFAARDAFFKLAGNHDLALLRRRPGDLPFPVRESLRLEIGEKRLWLFHGHQVSRLDWVFQSLGALLLRWLLHPLGIGNYTVARSSRRRFRVEQRAYLYARARKMPAVIGHTHRPLFESLPRLDSVKMEIENLIRRYPQATATEKPDLERQLSGLKQEYVELQGKEPRQRGEGLYHAGPLLPCLFNSGCGIGRHGITAIEFDSRRARLVYWFDRRRSEKYIEAEGFQPEPLAGTDFYRVVLKQEELDYIFTRINLLG
ncbi:MAG: metallophosphoesterase [Acidobacteria bacterium]|jgi:predicted phosphodiesterase|nr:metallophosphoesterase [Acidobacteriota bacterium]